MGAATLTAAVIAVALAIPFAPYLAARANISGPVPTEARSIDERLALADLGLRVVADHPLLGTGLGTMPQAMKQTDPTFDFAFQPAHVVLIDVAAEIGLAGALCYSSWSWRRASHCSTTGAAGRAGWRVHRRPSRR